LSGNVSYNNHITVPTFILSGAPALLAIRRGFTPSYAQERGMRHDTPPAIFFTVVLGTVATVALIDFSSVCAADVVTDALAKKGAFTCFEFWLNRYQTLLAGMIALFAAGLAFYAVRKQVTAAIEQVKVTAGLIAPDFWIQPASNSHPGHGEIPDCILFCVNQNRRPIDITSIRMMKPGCDFAVAIPGGPILTQTTPGEVRMSWRVPGTRPNAAAAHSCELRITFSGQIPEDAMEKGQTQIALEVGYTVLAPEPRLNIQSVHGWIDVAI
jgi:hypothetical protein